MVILFVASGIGSHTKNFRSVFAPKQRFCIISARKKMLNNELRLKVWSTPEKSKILATGGVIPRLLETSREYYQAGYFSKRLDAFDYLILERAGSGKTFPLTQDYIEETIKFCGSAKEHNEKLLENQYFFMIKDPSRECLEKIYKKWLVP